MTPVLAALLLAAASADGHIGEEPAPIPAQATPEATATTPAEKAPEATATPPAGAAGEASANPTTGEPQRLPEATASQVPAKPAAPRQQLKILAQESRMEAYAQFRSLYETARFDEALPYAKRVVELSEKDAEREHELPIAYNNLGATQYQLGDYEGATASYKQSLELLESTQGISSRRLVVPLAGLGAVYAAQDQHQVAAEHLRPRARGEPPGGRPVQPAATAAARSGCGQPLRVQAISPAPNGSTCTRSRSPNRTSVTATNARCRRCSSSRPSMRACASSSPRA